MTEQEALIALNMISGIGYARYRALHDTFGSGVAILIQPEAALRQVRGIGPVQAATVVNWRDKIDLARELTLAQQGQITILTLADDAYPQALRELPDPPLALYIRGLLPDFSCHNSVAIVGTRNPSRYGQRMAEQLTCDAVRSGFVIVSGLALGIDAVAHRAAVENRGTTIGVLGGGLMRFAPQENLDLGNAMIRSGGAILSEFPLEFPVNRQSFPRRNRIVAALAQGTIVVEAGENSGALITARNALEQGKSVFAVPGRADDHFMSGNHALIRDNAAKLIVSFQDVLDDFEFLPGFSRNLDLAETEHPYASTSATPSAPPVFFNEQETRIYTQLQQMEEATLDALLTQLNELDSGRLMGTLLALEMRNLVRRGPGGVYRIG